MRSGFVKVFALALVLLVLGACSKSGAVEIGAGAPDISIKDVDGAEVSLSSLKGNVIILNFFGTWCPPCRAEIPDFIKLQNNYASKGFTVVGVSREAPGDVKSFVTGQGINYPVWIDGTGKAHNIYGPIRGIPTTFIIDKNFKIQRMYVGARSGEVFENDVLELLK